MEEKDNHLPFEEEPREPPRGRGGHIPLVGDGHPLLSTRSSRRGGWAMVAPPRPNLPPGQACSRLAARPKTALAHVTALLYRGAGLTSSWSARPLCPHQPFPTTVSPHNLLHTSCPPPASRPLAPPCTSANGGVKVNVGFLVDGPEDRRVIGRISLSWNMKVLPTPGWVACHTMTVPMTAYLAPVHLPTA